jgi:hypothetical protein
MKLRYYPETDSLYIDHFDKTSAEPREVARGVRADFDPSTRLRAGFRARWPVSTSTTPAGCWIL